MVTPNEQDASRVIADAEDLARRVLAGEQDAALKLLEAARVRARDNLDLEAARRAARIENSAELLRVQQELRDIKVNDKEQNERLLKLERHVDELLFSHRGHPVLRMSPDDSPRRMPPGQSPPVH
jgi:cell division septum initiation protein DivIVA